MKSDTILTCQQYSSTLHTSVCYDVKASTKSKRVLIISIDESNFGSNYKFYITTSGSYTLHLTIHQHFWSLMITE